MHFTKQQINVRPDEQRVLFIVVSKRHTDRILQFICEKPRHKCLLRKFSYSLIPISFTRLFDTLVTKRLISTRIPKITLLFIFVYQSLLITNGSYIFQTIVKSRIWILPKISNNLQSDSRV